MHQMLWEHLRGSNKMIQDMLAERLLQNAEKVKNYKHNKENHKSQIKFQQLCEFVDLAVQIVEGQASSAKQSLFPARQTDTNSEVCNERHFWLLKRRQLIEKQLIKV